MPTQIRDYVNGKAFDLWTSYVEKTRGDMTWQFYARISNNKLGWYNLVPAISYTYITRDSNVPGYI